MHNNAKFIRVAAILLALYFGSSFSYGQGRDKTSTSPGYKLVKSVPIAGDDFWDYVTMDSDARRVYVTHGTHVVVVSADDYSVVGDIPDTPGVHGVALAPSLNRGFISDGRANKVTIFDLKTLKTIGEVTVGQGPDAIVYDDATKRVFTMNGHSNDSTAINAADGKVLGTIPLDGRPEFTVADGRGNVYLNIEDKSQMVRLDAQKLSVVNRWPMSPCEGPSGLAMDTKNRRLFAGCDNKIMAVIDADSGKVIATPPIGEGVDANAFDPGTNLAFASNGEGNITVVHEDSPDKFSVVQTVPTKKSARTMAVDTHTHSLFLPAADFTPPPAGQRRGAIVPHSFVLLVISLP